MPAKSSEKITFISHTKVKAIKVVLILLSLLLLMIPVWHLVVVFQGQSHVMVMTLIYPVVLLRLVYYLYKGIRAVEFDSSFLYVMEGDMEVIVPLSNIKKVDIRNLAGIYEITFFDKIQSGSDLFFKPSLIYPLDFNKQDAKVNELRDYARKAKQKVEANPGNQLTS
ncbi:hypothetical protein BH09BAC3_BH09BAC3_36460 [soil metagenome]